MPWSSQYGLIDIGASIEITSGQQSVSDVQAYRALDSLVAGIARGYIVGTSGNGHLPFLASPAYTGRTNYAELYHGSLQYALFPYRLWLIDGLTLGAYTGGAVLGVPTVEFAQVSYSQTSPTGLGSGFASTQDVPLSSWIAMYQTGNVADSPEAHWLPYVWMLTCDYPYAPLVPPGYRQPAIIGTLSDDTPVGQSSPQMDATQAWSILCDEGDITQDVLVWSDNTLPRHKGALR